MQATKRNEKAARRCHQGGVPTPKRIRKSQNSVRREEAPASFGSSELEAKESASLAPPVATTGNNLYFDYLQTISNNPEQSLLRVSSMNIANYQQQQHNINNFSHGNTPTTTQSPTQQLATSANRLQLFNNVNTPASTLLGAQFAMHLLESIRNRQLISAAGANDSLQQPALVGNSNDELLQPVINQQRAQFRAGSSIPFHTAGYQALAASSSMDNFLGRPSCSGTGCAVATQPPQELQAPPTMVAFGQNFAAKSVFREQQHQRAPMISAGRGAYGGGLMYPLQSDIAAVATDRDSVSRSSSSGS